MMGINNRLNLWDSSKWPALNSQQSHNSSLICFMGNGYCCRSASSDGIEAVPFVNKTERQCSSMATNGCYWHYWHTRAIKLKWTFSICHSLVIQRRALLLVSEHAKKWAYVSSRWFHRKLTFVFFFSSLSLSHSLLPFFSWFFDSVMGNIRANRFSPLNSNR